MSNCKMQKLVQPVWFMMEDKERTTVLQWDQKQISWQVVVSYGDSLFHFEVFRNKNYKSTKNALFTEQSTI